MRIAFIGLGNMGRHMAANLQKAGHDVVVHDVRQRRPTGHLANGARWANSAAEAAQGAELILTSLPGPEAGRGGGAGRGRHPAGRGEGRGLRRPLDQLADPDPPDLPGLRGTGRPRAGCAGQRRPDRGRARHAPGDGRRRRGDLRARSVRPCWGSATRSATSARSGPARLPSSATTR